ncbi:MAG: Ig-like domain-containing protein [Verrucomicrobiales bacterium]|nr:Ig-like domain-containing protein [Verrucomicrobiales bacterium]
METCYEPIDVRCAAPSVHSPVRRRPGQCRGGPAGWSSALLTCLSLQAGTITWDGGGDGASWNDPLNWSGDTLPGQTDDAVIDVPGDPTIVLSGSVNVRSLNCEEAIQVAGTLSVRGGASAINGPTTLTGSLYAYDGAVLNAPNLGSIEVGAWQFLHAEGVGSRINLPSVGSVNFTSNNRLHFRTRNSGRIDLPALTTVAGVNSLQVLEIDAQTAGQIDVSGLASPAKWVNLIYESNGAIALPGSLEMTGSSITLYGPDTPSDFGWLTGFDGSLYAYNGAVLNAPNLTSLEAGGWRDIRSEGVGSWINLPSVGSVSFSSNNGLHLRARDSGRIDLPALATVGGVNYTQALEVDARSGGQIDVSGLVSPARWVNLIYESNGAIALPGSLEMTGSSITLYGPDTPSDLPNLTHFDGSVHVYDGAVFGASGIASLALGSDLYLHAQGAGSLIDLPGLASVATDPGIRFRARAEGEGTISMPNAIAALGLLVDLTADGLNSLVDVSTFAVHRLNSGSVLNGVNGGVILIQQENRPPVAADDEAAALSDLVLALNPAKLLLNDVDPDGDTLSLTLPSGTTAQGGAVALVGGRVEYVAPPGYDGPDSFTYTAHDGFGGSAVATVRVNVRSYNRQASNLVSLTPGPDGCHGRMVGVPGRTYRIEVSADLETWAPLPGGDEFTAGLDGMFDFVDSGAAGEPCRFYRLGLP